MVQIAILMTCHNRKDKTLACLEQLYLQGGLDQEYNIQVYLVDDGSNDGTTQAVLEAYPFVNIIKGDGNLYWNRGMYTAWASASSTNHDFYLWLNDDTYLYKYALAEMLSAAQETNSKAIICGCIESPINVGELTYGGGNMEGSSYKNNYPAGNIAECDIINGNCVLIPRYVFNAVGNLDWTFIHAIGDNDYSLRARKLGISSFTTGRFVASCESHATLPKWCLPKVKLTDRICNLYSPLGYSHPNHQFIFEQRHFGLLTATKHYLSIHLRVLIPSLWK